MFALISFFGLDRCPLVFVLLLFCISILWTILLSFWFLSFFNFCLLLWGEWGGQCVNFIVTTDNNSSSNNSSSNNNSNMGGRGEEQRAAYSCLSFNSFSGWENLIQTCASYRLISCDCPSSARRRGDRRRALLLLGCRMYQGFLVFRYAEYQMRYVL